MSLEHMSGLRAPVWTDANDSWMDGIDPDRRQLHDQRPDQPGNGSVYRCDHNRTRIRLVLRAATEQQNRAVVLQARDQGVDHLRIADQFQRYQPEGALGIEVAHLVLVPFDRSEHEVINVANTAKRAGDA